MFGCPKKTKATGSSGASLQLTAVSDTFAEIDRAPILVHRSILENQGPAAGDAPGGSGKRMGGGRSARRNGEPVRADFAIGGRQEVAGVVARDDRIVGVDLVAVDVELVAGEAVMVAHHHGLDAPFGPGFR